MERPYFTMKELAELFSISTASLHNKIYQETFPLPTYKLGKIRVADKAVVAFYFEKHRQQGMALV